MDKVQYNQFYISARIEPEGNTKNRFRVVGQIWSVHDETQIVNSWSGIKEFGSGNEAYKYGLEACRAWINEHA